MNLLYAGFTILYDLVLIYILEGDLFDGLVRDSPWSYLSPSDEQISMMDLCSIVFFYNLKNEIK